MIILMIICLDDWYVYFCDGDVLVDIVCDISCYNGCVLIMFNMVFFVIIIEMVLVYCECIMVV